MTTPYPHWRTVQSGLPDQFVTVLAYGALDRPGATPEVLTAFVGGNGWATTELKKLRDVTHWTAFPDPPGLHVTDLAALREGVADTLAGAMKAAVQPPPAHIITP